MNEMTMDDQHNYAINLQKIVTIAEDDSTPIQVRQMLASALLGIHDYNIKLFKLYMDKRQRLDMYEY
jgi:hypothetical protein